MLSIGGEGETTLHSQNVSLRRKSAFDLWPLSLKIFSAMAARMRNISAYVGVRWSKYSTHLTVCSSGVLPYSARACTVEWLTEKLTEFCFEFRFGFCSTLLDFTVTLLLPEPLHSCTMSLAHFCSEYSRRRGVDVSQFSRSAMFTRPISCARSTVTVAATARPICRMLCTGRVTHYRQAVYIR